MPIKHKDRDGHTIIERDDPFDCVIWCGDGVGLPPEGDPQRQARHCTLPGFYKPWSAVAHRDRARLKVWQGAPKCVHADGYVDPRPPEDIEADGCPGGWARCRFAASFTKYIRPRVQGGAHDSNPRVHAGTPEHILDALRFFEQHQARAHAEFQRKAN